MAVDTRLKRQSAWGLLLPFKLSSVPPGTNGVVQAEWQASAWMYSGITADTPIWTNIILEGINTQDGKFYQIIGRYKER